MKGGNFSCASPSCLAVCTSIHQRSMVRPAIVNKANLRDPRKTKPLKPLPKPPSNPKKSRKSSEYRTSTGTGSSSIIIITKDLISPANSSRYLLNDSASFPDLEPELEVDGPCLVPDVEMQRFNRDEPSTVILSSSSSSSSSKNDGDQVWAPSLFPISPPKLLLQQQQQQQQSQPAILSSSYSTRSQHDINDQVVALRVSLHCKGCEGKVRKHISKMGRSDIIQHRFRGKEGDCDGERYAARRAQQRVEGEECRILAVSAKHIIFLGRKYTIL